MWEKQILTKAIGIQKENLGLNNHALFFFQDNEQQ